MKSVEEIIGDKILELLHLGLSIIVKPDITIDKVAELDEDQIKEIKHALFRQSHHHRQRTIDLLISFFFPHQPCGVDTNW